MQYVDQAAKATTTALFQRNDDPVALNTFDSSHSQYGTRPFPALLELCLTCLTHGMSTILLDSFVEKN